MRKNFIIAASVCLSLGILAGIFAYTLTIRENDSDIIVRENEMIYKPVVTEEPEEETVYEPIYYCVQMSGSLLNLYEVQGETKKTVKSFEISPQMFPAEDIELLQSGIKAFTLEDGLEIVENFIS